MTRTIENDQPPRPVQPPLFYRDGRKLTEKERDPSQMAQPNRTAGDLSQAVSLPLQTAGREPIKVRHKPRLNPDGTRRGLRGKRAWWERPVLIGGVLLLGGLAYLLVGALIAIGFSVALVLALRAK